MEKTMVFMLFFKVSQIIFCVTEMLSWFFLKVGRLHENEMRAMEMRGYL